MDNAHRELVVKRFRELVDARHIASAFFAWSQKDLQNAVRWLNEHGDVRNVVLDAIVAADLDDAGQYFSVPMPEDVKSELAVVHRQLESGELGWPEWTYADNMALHAQG